MVDGLVCDSWCMSSEFTNQAPQPPDDRIAELLGPEHSPLTSRMGLEVLSVSAQEATARFPVEGNTQAMGLWHGGASAVLVETLGSVAASCYAGPGRLTVGTELNVTHHRAVRQGWVHARAEALHLGATTATYEVVLTDDAGRRIATGRVSCRLMRAPSNRGTTRPAA